VAQLPPPPPTTRLRTIARYVLAAQMIFAGFSHLFWAREEFQAVASESGCKSTGRFAASWVSIRAGELK
jgi:hypothetical protein